MLKKVSVIVMVLILSACTSQPVDKRFKGAGDFDKVEAAKTRVSLGLTYLKNGNFSQAKFNLDKALDFDPRSGQANFAMAFYYQQVDEVKRAHEYYKQAIDFSDDDPDVLNSYGAFLCKQGDYGQAKRYFLKAVDDKRYVSTAGTYENLAICAESQGLIEEAIAYFNSALNHQPTRASSLLYLSQLYVKTKQWDAAKKTVWKYERNSNVSAESLWLSFQISQGQQNLREAVEFAEILKRLYPSNANTKKAVASLGKFQPDMAVTQKTKPTVINKEPLVSITMADIESSNTAAAANASRSPYKVDKPPVPQATQTEMPAQPATANVEAVGAKVKNIE
ncbi:MAG: type IV pilus assembly protein PilF, partial [Glaciecola sp.]